MDFIYYIFIRGDNKWIFTAYSYQDALERKQRVEEELPDVELVICKKKGQNDGLPSKPYIPNK